MRLVLAQIDTTVGDFEGNLARVRAAAERARGSDLVVFPELTLCGYMPRDLLEEADFVAAGARALDRLAEWTRNAGVPPVLVGLPVEARDDAQGKPLWNAAALVDRGRVETVAKRLLPTYDVFDERRYFRPGPPSRPLAVGGARVGITICEDAWSRRAPYGVDPIAELAAQGAELIVNLSASPWERGKQVRREALMGEHATAHRLPVALCNLVGGNDQLLFDGQSFLVDAGGRVTARGSSFGEDLLLVDSGRGPVAERLDDVEMLRRALVLGIRDYFAKTGFSQALVGMSGGVDSAVTACLAVDALGPAHVTGVGMPGPFSAPMSLEDARALADALSIRFETLPIGPAYDLLTHDLAAAWGGDKPFGIAEENLQARLRGTVLMALANERGALVLVPSNKSELATGYSTLYGDMVGALAPIADVYKTQVFQLARRYPVPERSRTRPPSAELRPDQRDEDTLPPYPVLDAILELAVERRLGLAAIVAQGHDEATVRRVLRSVSLSEYKRQQAAPVIKVSPTAFGLGRRYPIVERWRGGAG